MQPLQKYVRVLVTVSTSYSFMHVYHIYNVIVSLNTEGVEEDPETPSGKSNLTLFYGFDSVRMCMHVQSRYIYRLCVCVALLYSCSTLTISA